MILVVVVQGFGPFCGGFEASFVLIGVCLHPGLWALCYSSYIFLSRAYDVFSLVLILFSPIEVEILLVGMARVWLSFLLSFLFIDPIEVDGSSIEVESGLVGEVGRNFMGVFVVLVLVGGCVDIVTTFLLFLCHISPMEVETLVEFKFFVFDSFCFSIVEGFGSLSKTELSGKVIMYYLFVNESEGYGSLFKTHC